MKEVTKYHNINRGYMTLDVWKESVNLSVLARKKLKIIPAYLLN